jgi:hypothetical protein
MIRAFFVVEVSFFASGEEGIYPIAEFFQIDGILQARGRKANSERFFDHVRTRPGRPG